MLCKMSNTGVTAFLKRWLLFINIPITRPMKHTSGTVISTRENVCIDTCQTTTTARYVTVTATRKALRQPPIQWPHSTSRPPHVNQGGDGHGFENAAHNSAPEKTK